MTPAELPGGRKPLLLFWFGGCTLLGSALISLQAGGDLSRLWLLLAAAWGAIAVLFAVLLRQPRGPVLGLVADVWLLIWLGAAFSLWWSRNG